MKKILMILICITSFQALAQEDQFSLLSKVLKKVGISNNRVSSVEIVLEGKWLNPKFAYDQNCQLRIKMAPEAIYIYPYGMRFVQWDWVKNSEVPEVFGIAYDKVSLAAKSLVAFQRVNDSLVVENPSTLVFSREQKEYIIEQPYERIVKSSLKINTLNDEIMGFELSNYWGKSENGICLFK